MSRSVTCAFGDERFPESSSETLQNSFVHTDSKLEKITFRLLQTIIDNLIEAAY